MRISSASKSHEANLKSLERRTKAAGIEAETAADPVNARALVDMTTDQDACPLPCPLAHRAASYMGTTQDGVEAGAQRGRMTQQDVAGRNV